MAPIAMSIKVDGDRARGFLHGLKVSSRDLKPVRREFAEYMRSSTIRTFAAGGRPKRWKPSQRVLKTAKGKTLIKSGRLRSSITGRVVGKEVRVGSNVAYARPHQLGVRATVVQNVRAHTRKPRKGRVTVVRAHTRKMRMNLPARPFLKLLREDKRYLNRLILDHFQVHGRRR